MVLGAVAPNGLGHSPYKICEQGLSSLKASKNLEFPRINLEFPKNKSRIPSGFYLGILDLIFIFLKERFLLVARSCRCAFLHLRSKYQKKLNIA